MNMIEQNTCQKVKQNLFISGPNNHPVFMNFQVTVLTSHCILFDKITLFISLVFDNAANYRKNVGMFTEAARDKRSRYTQI